MNQIINWQRTSKWVHTQLLSKCPVIKHVLSSLTTNNVDYPYHLKAVFRVTIYFPKIHFNIMLPSMSHCPKYSVSIIFSNKNVVLIYYFSICTICPANINLLVFGTLTIFGEAPNYIIILHFVPCSSVFPFQIPSITVLSADRDQVSHPYRTIGRNIVPSSLIFTFLEN
jgi:hypothetical protein